MDYSYVYIMANQKNGIVYIGVTTDLPKRVSEHRLEKYKGFTQKYKVHSLVYYEVHGCIESAIIREKKLKKWNRNWKLKLIEENNPEWEDLFLELFK